jgi:hypothetical protein
MKKTALFIDLDFRNEEKSNHQHHQRTAIKESINSPQGNLLLRPTRAGHQSL